ncbi:MAG: hypothetical protein LBD25_04500 [Coriobacteriales bacterium]|jgi:uncharacterized membrane protein YuzA (DUF378 family)|nr:hypothetical protein [Coriobacteriales bacterium]
MVNLFGFIQISETVGYAIIGIGAAAILIFIIAFIAKGYFAEVNKQKKKK